MIEKTLHDIFGFTEFRSGQQQVVEAILAGRSALAVFPTGGGKSLCYQLPALHLKGLTVVVSPLIALMKDQIDFLTRKGVAAARLDSSLGKDEVFAIGDRLENGTLKLLYVAPERFNNERFLAQLERSTIDLFVIDEAHCISEWGHNFRPDYMKLAGLVRQRNIPRILALTATATPPVVEDIRSAFDIAAEDAVITGFYRPNLTLLTTPVTSDTRDRVLLERLRKRPPGPTIIYVTLQKTAEQVAETLTDAGLPATAYHAGLESEERERIQNDWMASDAGIVVATIAFGMGIDKADVRYVYHYNLPKSLESYSQEIGRAGRDGAGSAVELLACRTDVPTLENFVYGDTPTQGSLRSLMQELLSLGERFDVSLYDLSQRHDLRQLVLRTALTYLELSGVLQQGTPTYAGYELRLLEGWTEDKIAAAFPGEPGRLVKQVFTQAKLGRTWYKLNPAEAAEALGQERRRVVRMLEVFEERGMVELRASDVRSVYTRLREREDAKALAADLYARFLAREKAEIERLQQVLSLIEHPGCQVNALVGHFGEPRQKPCGHCTFCRTKKPTVLPALEAFPPISADWAHELRGLRGIHPQALGEPRQLARWLCGLTSPATSRARLGKHPHFGALEERPFAEVLAWCEKLTSG
jgi:ATP-dependent DNA helicase RecQ